MRQAASHSRFQRTVALWVMTVFVALSLLASGPHPHDFLNPRHYADGASYGHRVADADASCPLCDWQAHSAAVVSGAPPLVLADVAAPLLHPLVASHADASPAGRPVGRGPPSRFV